MVSKVEAERSFRHCHTDEGVYPYFMIDEVNFII